MSRLTLAGLIKMELPTGDVRLCDGGTLTFDAEAYTSYDSVFGTIEPPDAYEEGLGDAAPVHSLTFLPPAGSSASALSSAAFQGARVRAWIAEVSSATGLIAGTPELMADLAIDTTRLVIGGTRRLEVQLVSYAERLFVRNTGNSLNSAFHQRIYPGELGLDNAAGVPGPFAWGAKAPPRGTSGGGGGGDDGTFGRIIKSVQP